jgi:hypothetical protein
MLPKGTLAPNSGNISSNMKRAQIIKTQNKYCGKSGVVYVTGATGNTGFTGSTGSTGPTGTFSNVPELTAIIGVRTPLLTTYGPTGLNIGTETATSINIGTNVIGINIGTTGPPPPPGQPIPVAIIIGTNNTTTSLKGIVNVGTKLTSPIIAATGTGTAMTIGSNLTTGSLTIGGTNSVLTVNGNITMGTSGSTIFTTSGQQIRLGYAHTQAIGSVTSSFGPFFKSFGPDDVTGTYYDIAFEGATGIFTPTGLDGVGGLLTIVIKSTSSKMATLTYNVMSRSGVNSLTIISNVFGGWTTNPTISASPDPGHYNNIRITFNSSDYQGAKVSWLFMGA